MALPLSQHQAEIERNGSAWQAKPLLRETYADFYHRIAALVDLTRPGRIVEIGSGIGNLRAHLPTAVCTDLFANPWIDVACDGYELPFRAGTVSHLILVDVLHHLETPGAFLQEAQRVLSPGGRLILLEPYVSWFSYPLYGLLHHEPVAWGKPLDRSRRPPSVRRYYAAQGNATRLFFHQEQPDLLAGWTVFHREAFATFAYLLSGGFSKPALAPVAWLPCLRRWDRWCSRWPRLLAARCLVGLCIAR